MRKTIFAVVAGLSGLLVASCSATDVAIAPQPETIAASEAATSEQAASPKQDGSGDQASPLVESLLTPEQIRLLEGAGMRIALPGYVPEGFEVEFVRAEVARTGIGGAQSLIAFVRYAEGETQCFAIRATEGGIGGLPPGEESYPINSPTFGESTLEYGLYGQSNNPTFLSNWMGEGPFYSFMGAGVDAALERCQNISADEAVRVVESLQY
ncbi:MAG: hypothetical protein AAFY26_12870 [Cyanobacteria bacterium J06638_22]